jgi:catechol 2,3-dioxygenase-like lactoylglutathione lyase family enzyme
MIAHITLATRDVPRSVAFFRQALGWQPVARPGNIGKTAAWREFGRHIAVTFPLAEFPRLKQQLQAHGGTLIEPLRGTPFARFFFRDPNGYVFEVVDQDHDEPRPVD